MTLNLVPVLDLVTVLLLTSFDKLCQLFVFLILTLFINSFSFKSEELRNARVSPTQVAV